MKKNSLILVFLFSALFARAQTIEAIRKDKLLQLFKNDSTTLVINFWASWCKPCMQEMPHFYAADSIYASKGVQFVFVSFDMIEDLQRAQNLVNKMKIPGQQYLLDETDMNALIDSVDSGWSGGLPATWFISPMYRKPWYQNFEHSHDLFKEIDLLIAATNETEK
jgi:thiol-disulfide isomerase/thioredoxin